ncbi:MAG TPA: hypothetical protein V6D03_00800 [Candidatus Caenarcaniphilales bacterium]
MRHGDSNEFTLSKHLDRVSQGASSFGRNTQIESLAVHELVVQHQIHAGDRSR